LAALGYAAATTDVASGLGSHRIIAASIRCILDGSECKGSRMASRNAPSPSTRRDHIGTVHLNGGSTATASIVISTTPAEGTNPTILTSLAYDGRHNLTGKHG
jgi:hypothetical protein